MKPICVPCQRFFKIRKTGVRFIEAMPTHDGALAGTAEPHKWQPYKLWAGDLWQCPQCGAVTISGVGREPIAEHFEERFSALAEGASIVINDC